MALCYIVRQNGLICIVSRHFSYFFLSINFSPLMGSLHCWYLAGLLHAPNPKTPLVPRTPSLLINRYWTELVSSCPAGCCARESVEFLKDAEEENLLIRTGEDFFFPLKFIKKF